MFRITTAGLAGVAVLVCAFVAAPQALAVYGDAADAQSGALDPAITAAVASHQTPLTAADLRSPDTLDAVAQTGADLRSPDTHDATGVIAVPSSTPQLSVAGDPVFDWADAGIGAVAGFAIALLVGGMIRLSHRGRQGSLVV